MNKSTNFLFYITYILTQWVLTVKQDFKSEETKEKALAWVNEWTILAEEIRKEIEDGK